MDSQFKNGAPATSDFFIAHRHGDGFERATESEVVFKRVNGNQLQYAAAISSDGLELFFTRVRKPSPTPSRESGVRQEKARVTHSTSQLVSAITGFAEGPTLSPGGLSLYYHAREQGKFVVFRVTRTLTAAGE